MKAGPVLCILFVILVALVGMVGEYHFVSVDGSTERCEKESWSLSNTFVRLDDFVGRSRFELADRAPVLRALERCHLITIGGR